MSSQVSLFSRFLSAVALLALLPVSVSAEIYEWVTPRGNRAYSNVTPPPGVQARMYKESLAESRNDPFAYLKKKELPSGRVPGWKPECEDDYSGVIEAMRQRVREVGSGTKFLAGRITSPGVPQLLMGPHLVTGRPLEKRFAIKKVFDTTADRGVALAYPEGMACPSRPPTGKFAIKARAREGASECDDFREAARTLEFSLERDRPIAGMWKNLAGHYTKIADAGYFAADPAPPRPGDQWSKAGKQGVVLPPWLVETHIAKMQELWAETEEVLEELTVALEEVNEAARVKGCWQ